MSGYRRGRRSRLYAAFKGWVRIGVEGLFSSIKTCFGGSVRALEGNGPENEILLKCIRHFFS